MCIIVDKCCFCVDIETATRAIALGEAVLSVPMLIHGLASLSVLNLAVGLLLFVSAWVLFDGSFLQRKTLLMGWLLGTIVKVVSCSGLGVMFTYLVAQELQPELATEVSSKIVTAIRRMGKNYISCIISWTDMSPEQETLFLVVYALTFFVISMVYMYFFAVVYSYREKIIRREKKRQKKRKKKYQSYKEKMLDEFESCELEHYL